MPYMNHHTRARLAAALGLLLLLTACARLPADARRAVLNTMGAGNEPRIISAQRVEPLPEDTAAGADEVWCVNLSYTCWVCTCGDYRICGTSRLLRHIAGHWQVTPVITVQARAAWEERGCELAPDIIE